MKKDLETLVITRNMGNILDHIPSLNFDEKVKNEILETIRKKTEGHLTFRESAERTYLNNAVSELKLN